MTVISRYWKAIGAGVGPPIALFIATLLTELDLEMSVVQAAAITAAGAVITTVFAPKNAPKEATE